MTATDATQTTFDAWRYVAEGGASLVVAYIGPRHSAFDGKILRLRKTSQQPLSLATHNERSLDGSEEREAFTRDFQMKVISRLVPNALLPELGIARVDTPWLKGLAARLESSRPTSRREKDGLDLYQTTGVVETNLVGGTGLVIEIKPKWGFLPSLVHLSPETKEIKTKYCRFCIHAHYKRLQGEAVASDFCPLDMYSGEHERVDRALSSLWSTWSTAEDGKLHNMRVFLDGEVVEARDVHTVNRVHEWLISNYSKAGVDAEQTFKAKIIERLDQSSILSILSRLQRTLDPLDIEGVSSLAGRANLRPTPTDISLDDWVEFVDQYLGAAQTYNHSHPDVDKVDYYRLAYILSASFKDCSVIINLSDVLHHAVAVIDLEPKSPSKLAKWEELDKMIVRAFSDVERVKCVDAFSAEN